MGRTFSAVPYTYLKRSVYYFVRRIPSDLQTFYRADRDYESAARSPCTEPLVHHKDCLHDWMITGLICD